MPLKFDPQAALRHAQAISRPRLVGSAEEAAVREELAAQLESSGCRVERELFYFWNAANYALYLQVLMAMILVALSLIHLISYPVASLGLLLLLAGFPFITRACEWLALFPDTHRGSVFTKALQLAGLLHSAQNLVAVPKDQTAPSGRKRIYFIAHYDSKSQPLPITVRAILFMVLLSAIAGFILFTLLVSMYSFLAPVLIPIGLVVIVAGAPQILNFPGNKSPGAIDNASAVGVVLHLAELLQTRPEMRSGAHITYLLTSAEEMYLLGASAHAIRHAVEFTQATVEGKLLFLNFDGIGIEGRLAYDGRGGKRPRGILARLTEESAQALGIRVAPFRLIGALFDHIPFARRNLDAVTLLSIGKASRTIHTRRDTVSQLHPCGFEKTGNLALEILRRWSSAGK